MYLNEDYNLANTNIILTLPLVFPEGNSLQSSCDSLSTVTFSGGSFMGSYYRTIHILVTLSQDSSIEWVHVGEVRFIGIDGPTCLQPSPRYLCQLQNHCLVHLFILHHHTSFHHYVRFLLFFSGLNLFHPCCQWL